MLSAKKMQELGSDLHVLVCVCSFMRVGRGKWSVNYYAQVIGQRGSAHWLCLLKDSHFNLCD